MKKEILQALLWYSQQTYMRRYEFMNIVDLESKLHIEELKSYLDKHGKELNVMFKEFKEELIHNSPFNDEKAKIGALESLIEVTEKIIQARACYERTLESIVKEYDNKIIEGEQ